MIPRDENDARFTRDVQNILRADELGMRWGHNIGPEVTFEYIDSRAPFTVNIQLRERPRAVFCLYAEDQTTRSNGAVSGARVQWAWLNGEILVKDIDIPTAASTYKVTLGILRG